jgi:hypothetical protein
MNHNSAHRTNKIQVAILVGKIQNLIEKTAVGFEIGLNNDQLLH